MPKKQSQMVQEPKSGDKCRIKAHVSWVGDWLGKHAQIKKQNFLD